MAMSRVTVKPVMPPKREASAVARANNGAVTSRKSAAYCRLIVHHIACSAGSAGLAANWQMSAVMMVSGATKLNTASQISKSWRVAETPVVWKYSPTPVLALVSPSRAAVNKPQSRVQVQSVPQAARIRAGWTSSGFSVALEISGSAKGRAITAKAQIAQALRWRIVANVSRKSLMAGVQFIKFLRALQVWPFSLRWRALWPSIISALGISIES